MNPSISTKFVAAAALTLAAFGAASAAHARSDVYFSVGVQVPGVYVEPAPVYVRPLPVYVEPRPVYVAPRPVYVQPPAYGGPVEVYQRRGEPAYDSAYDSAYEQERAWRHAQWHRRQWRQHHHDGDRYDNRGRHWD